MKARFIFFLAIVFVLAGCAVKQYTPPRATPSYAPPPVNYFQRAHSHFEKGDYDLAIRDYTEDIRLDPKNAAASYNNRGIAYRVKGKHDLAIRDFTEAIRLNPNKGSYRHIRGIEYLRKGEHDLAIHDFTKAIRLNPKSAAAYLNRGDAYQRKGEHDHALHDFTEAIRLNPNNGLSYLGRGFCYFLRGENNKAEADWRKTADLMNYIEIKAGALENINLIYLKQGKWKTLLAHTDLVNALQNDLAFNWLSRAITAHQMGDHASASSAYGKWSTLRTENDIQELKKYLPKRLHLYLNELPTTIVTTRTVPTQVLWRTPRKTRILSVGVGDFKDPAIPKIDYAESDARGFASLIRSSGIPEENISHLANKNACRNDVTDALIKLKMATTESSETAIFYFSGHGAPLIKNGKIVDAALVPYNARENTLEYTGIKISTLRELLSDTRGNWIVILDACFSGKEGRNLMAKNIKGIYVVPQEFQCGAEINKEQLVDNCHQRG